MDAAAIYAQARTLGGTDSSGLTDDLAQTYMRIIVRSLYNTIKSRVGEGYFYDEWTSSLVANQREYSLPKRTSSVAGCNKVISLSLKLDSASTKYQKGKEVSIPMFEESVQTVAVDQPISYPLYALYDNSFFIYPTPLENVSDGIIIYGLSDPIDPSTGSAETVFKIPLEHHEAIAQGMAWKYFSVQTRTEKAAEAKATFDEMVNSMIIDLLGRGQDRMESVAPPTAHLE